MVLEHGRGETHVRRADDGAFRARRRIGLQAEVGRRAVNLVQRARRRGRVARHLVLLAVVGLRGVVARDAHRHRQRTDGLREVITHIVVADAVACLEGSRNRHAVSGGGSRRTRIGVCVGIRTGGRHFTCRQSRAVLQGSGRDNRRAGIVVRH